MKIIDIENPDFLKDLTISELEKLSQDMREFLIASLSKTGGHVSSNLGVVELTIALHKVFDTPKDKIIFDVGHQCYPHKILTGRAKYFDRLRQYKGLSGFIKRDESIYDVWEAGHASTSVSAALGFALSRDHKFKKEKIVVVIGDGSIAGGMSFEALNHAGDLKKDLIVILNDNAMSISKNVGGLSEALTKMRYSKKYYSSKKIIKKTLKNIPFIGKSMYRIANSIKSSLKAFLNISNTLFEDFGLNYYGPIDGHDYKDLIDILEYAKEHEGPILIHVLTKKGKGYKYAEEDKSGKWHGIAPFDIETGCVLAKSPANYESWSNIISWVLEDLASCNKTIFAVTPAMEQGSSLSKFKEKYPTRFVDVGIAEEHAITLCAGLASAKEKPFIAIYSTFLQRSYDQILHDVCRPNLNVIIGIDRSGLVGADGETHHGVFDIPFLAHMPNIVICMPKDSEQAQHLLNTCVHYSGPICIKYPRGKAFFKAVKSYETYEIGKWEYELNNNNRDVIITFGPHVLKLRDYCIENNLDIDIINAMFIKPLDQEMLNTLFAANKNIYVYEESMKIGGLHSMILQYANDCNYQGSIISFAIDDTFVLQGDVESLLKEQHLDYESITHEIIARR